MFGNSLLVPSKKGQVVRINPRNGSLVGAPFQPPLKPGVDVDWLEPAIIADGQEFMIADKTGRFFLVAADADTSLQKIAESQFPGTVRSRLLLVGETVFAVCQDNLSDKIVEIPAGIEIEFGKSVELPGGFVAGPVKIDDSSFVVMLEDGNLICYNTGLEEQWKVELPADKIAGNPELIGAEIVIAFQSGDIWRLNGQSGETVLKSNIGQPISSPPRRLGGRVFISGADGTLHEISSE